MTEYKPETVGPMHVSTPYPEPTDDSVPDGSQIPDDVDIPDEEGDADELPEVPC